ncbi:hypothetical protein DPMN_139484 [Dreissena polymorpha]|uniref:Uncharacterized protein n=1 Tax=Dreissena polymorpha TaxID=45954 RepID=A0A9D4G611_DREPO|nr:hypothetical protein DPMN_139484 [Dreissena polymorpha]
MRAGWLAGGLAGWLAGWRNKLEHHSVNRSQKLEYCISFCMKLKNSTPAGPYPGFFDWGAQPGRCTVGPCTREKNAVGLSFKKIIVRQPAGGAQAPGPMAWVRA